MKKTVILCSALLIAGMLTTSCKKSYTCNCKSEASNGLYTTPVSSTTIKAKTESDAASSCQAMGNVIASPSVGCNLGNW